MDPRRRFAWPRPRLHPISPKVAVEKGCRSRSLLAVNQHLHKRHSGGRPGSFGAGITVVRLPLIRILTGLRRSPSASKLKPVSSGSSAVFQFIGTLAGHVSSNGTSVGKSKAVFLWAAQRCGSGSGIKRDFGHQKGTFPGADRTWMGLVRGSQVAVIPIRCFSWRVTAIQIGAFSAGLN